jgi:mRNA-degrading endonuclease YafQ of YafQ-DinJ toxin-antitoxin module
MKIQTTRHFDKAFAGLPPAIKERAREKLALFFDNPQHPSLRVKKMQGHRYIWEGSITKSYRFTFQIHEDLCILRRIGTHDVLKKQ